MKTISRDPTQAELIAVCSAFLDESKNKLEFEVRRIQWSDWLAQPDSTKLLAILFRKELAVLRSHIQGLKDPRQDVTAAVVKPGDDRTAAVDMFNAMLDAISPPVKP